jgi:hypothetical protein
MDIKTGAPAIAKAEVEIAADPQTVWGVVSDFERWPSWNSEIRSMAMNGPLASGSTFAWKAGPGTIRSTLGEVDAPRKIAWSGVTFGIKAIDVFRLEPRDDGTLVTEEESWEGLLVRLLRGRMQRTLQAAIETGLRSLKAEAERQAADRRRTVA